MGILTDDQIKQLIKEKNLKTAADGQPFPLQYLNYLGDAAARHLASQQNGLF